MRTLSGIPNTDAPSSDYPGGRIRNKDNTAIPPIVGTPVIEQLYGDIVQFFQRLLVLGSVTANNLADNVTNGYQTITALINFILNHFTASVGITQAGSSTTTFVTPAGLASKDGGLITRYIDYSGWNMDSASTFNVDISSLNIAANKIKEINVLAVSATGLPISLLGSDGAHENSTIAGGILTNILLSREVGGIFDTSSDGWNNAGGSITIKYIP